MSSVVAALDRTRAWLEAHPPVCIESWTDRLLGLSIRCGDEDAGELEALLAAAPDVTVQYHRAEVDGFLDDWALELCIGATLLEWHDRMPPVLPDLARRVAGRLAGDWDEPHRSVYAWWAGQVLPDRAGMAPGPAPEDPRVAAYHHVHELLYATRYATRPASRADHVTTIAALERALVDTPLDADILGEVLLVERALEPADTGRIAELATRVVELLELPDTVAEDAFVPIHHEAVVVRAALTGLDRE